jgi:hypothetical protein
MSHQKSTTGSQQSRAAVPAGPSDRRVTPRFHVQFRAVFSGTPGRVLEGMGSVLDLSLGGCRVEAPFAVQQSLLMELRIYVPDLEWPLMVDGAVVQWVKGQTFGLRFLQLRQTEDDRLAQVIARVSNEEAP